MRIAVVSEGTFPEVSGVTIAVEQHLRFLAAHGHELLLVSPRYPEAVLARMPADERQATEVPRVQFDSDPIAPHRPESRVPSPAGARAIATAIEDFRPAAVVYHNPDRLVPELSKVWKRREVAGLAAARRVGAVPIALIHTLMPLIVARSGSWLWRTRVAGEVTRRIWTGIYNDNFEFAVTVDVAAREYLQSIGITVPLLAGAYNGVDTAIFHPGEPRAGGTPRVCWIGRLVPEKRATLLPALVRGFAAVGLDVEWVVIGDGPLMGSLRQQLPPGALRGWLPPAEVARELAGCDLYVSMSDTESFSLTASEALACGVPVVAPEVIGFKRLAALDVGLLYPASWLTTAGMLALAHAVAGSRPHHGEWAARARAIAPEQGWDAALGRLFAALGERTGLPFV